MNNIPTNYYAILNNAHEIKLDTSLFLQDLTLETKSLGISLETILPHIMTVTSHLLKKSIIKVIGNIKFNMAMVGFIVNCPGNDNSASYNYLLSIMRQLEKFNKIETDYSAIINRYDYDLIVNLFTKGINILYLNDTDYCYEFDTNLEQNVTLINTLLNSPEYVDFYKVLQRISINQPKIDICFKINYKEISNQIKLENQNNISIFCKSLISASPLIKYNSNEIKQAHNTPHVKLVSVLHLIDMIHNIERKYNFSPDAHEIINLYFNNINNINSTYKLHQKDPILYSIMDQSFRLVCRLSVIIFQLQAGYKILRSVNLSYKDDLTIQYDTTATNILHKLNENNFIVPIEAASLAVNLINYFNNHKLVLFGYKIKQQDFISNVKDIINQI